MEKLESEKFGVLSYKIVDHHYVVDVRWKDGRVSQHNFPEDGFRVYDLGKNRSKNERRRPLDFIDGKDALRILIDVSPLINEEDFTWLDYAGINKKAAA